MAFYHFSQNNSGGQFDYDESAGIAHVVIVEAKDIADALSKAQSIGIYFNGVAGGRDCGCCGDRWHEPYDKEGAPEPEYYGMPLAEAETFFAWMPEGREICVHYADGRKEWHGVKVRR